MKEKLAAIKEEALKQIEASDALEKLNEVKVNFLGKKGELTAVLKSMKDVAPEDRTKVGQMVNETRAEIEEVLEAAIVTEKDVHSHNTFENPEVVVEKAFDGYQVTENGLTVTMPANSVVAIRVSK